MTAWNPEVAGTLLGKREGGLGTGFTGGTDHGSSLAGFSAIFWGLCNISFRRWECGLFDLSIPVLMTALGTLGVFTGQRRVLHLKGESLLQTLSLYIFTPLPEV